MTPGTDQTDGRRVWIILPAFNEEANLPSLLSRIRMAMTEAGLPYQVLIVDDGSTDQTSAVAQEASKMMPIIINRHQANLGLGETIRDGILTACDLADTQDILVTLDADNSHTPELILRMVRHVREGMDVVIASRYRSGSRIRGLPLRRRVLSKVASLLFRALFPIRGVRDYTSGYRAYRAGALQDAIRTSDEEFFQEGGFQAMVDILLKLRTNRNLIFGEVPLILRYDLKSGASKMDVGKTIRRTLHLVARRLFGR